METPFATVITLLGWSVVILIVHILLQGQLATRERGLDWNASARDGEQKPLGTYAGRADRALRNFLETYAAFVGLALALAITNRAGGLGLIGAWTWFIARIVYIPLYLFGVPYLRSLVWLASLVGLVLMLIQLLF
ncbi:MAPEG family protein [Consotaella salsifontis]|uniref:Uncharacterized conserved protein, MAPEG superfamily n=1 Tax=Consotaella salsifontis TaxID=1365950 RepID=A0A1T4T583_9HYPH|nr:MAPEG family protein [Consotaella salsifontis]SKA35606.1 Uncharacterized conserved protein, MAPEG superfamily [Consotaella salsifontis]